MKKLVRIVFACVLASALCLGVASIGFADDEERAVDSAVESDGNLFLNAANIDVDDGDYTIDVALAGGSGKVSIASPANLTVKDHVAYAQVEWSSENYDYMVVDGIKYLPVSNDGCSLFEVPVTAYDKPITIYAETLAMSAPHEIEYTLTFDSASVMSVGGGFNALPVVIGVVVVVLVVIIVVIAARRRR